MPKPRPDDFHEHWHVDADKVQRASRRFILFASLALAILVGVGLGAIATKAMGNVAHTLATHQVTP